MILTVEVGVKFVPVKVIVNAEPAAGMMLGEMLESVGDGLFTVKFEYPLVPKLGDGLATRIDTMPPVAITDAAMVVVIVVEFTKVAACQDPLT